MTPDRGVSPHRLARLAVLGAGLLVSVVASAGTPANVLRDADLKAGAALDAATVGQLTAGSQVEILSFEGGWAKVKAAAGTGYTRMLNVRPLKHDGGAGANPLQSIDALGNVARTGSTGNAATTGAKGLSKTDLQDAQPNTAALEQFKTGAAKASAAPAKLQAREVDLLPEDADKR